MRKTLKHLAGGLLFLSLHLLGLPTLAQTPQLEEANRLNEQVEQGQYKGALPLFRRGLGMRWSRYQNPGFSNKILTRLGKQTRNRGSRVVLPQAFDNQPENESTVFSSSFAIDLFVSELYWGD
ncbi:MAG: hypothetical protein ACLFV6_11330 [Spirulinaceae cyanobacterium]